jgi:chitinase
MYQPLLTFSIILVSSIRCCSCDFPSPRSLLAAIMNYDVWGSFSPTVGPNSPLDDSCAPTKAGSAVSAVKAWTSANFPANQVKKKCAFLQNLLTKLSSFFFCKIALGVAAYGHSFHVTTSAALGSGNINLYPAFDKSQQPLGDSDTSTSASGTHLLLVVELNTIFLNLVLDPCGQPEGISGTFNFNGMIAHGFLNSNGTAANGIDYTFDNCSQTVRCLYLSHMSIPSEKSLLPSLLYITQLLRR